MAALCRVGELSITTFTCTALRAMQTRSIDEKAVRLSVRLFVCPSVKRVH